MKKTACFGSLFAAVFAAMMMLSACAPKVGSEAWCKEMDKKPKGNWTADEAENYAKSCIF